jgi:hypothetical protein
LSNQAPNSVAIGLNSGLTNQGYLSVGIGAFSGYLNKGRILSLLLVMQVNKINHQIVLP